MREYSKRRKLRRQRERSPSPFTGRYGGTAEGVKGLDQVEPGAVLGREGKAEAAWRPGVEPRLGFPSKCVRNDCRGST
jgi:hypothetical protein